MSTKGFTSAGATIFGQSSEFVTETENGLIFTYCDNVDDRTGVYEVEKNGEKVTYIKALNMVYVTKDDYFDGEIDSPWYYDAETNTFVQ